ncbi:hypothetical protein B0T22DRAFT_496957 [Podospora appendiculata]|uniref:Alpha-ketoglutarate-dependent dioxygenase AlkB-like domain-containing protein n=1 Tax=Podospora appendiculata TaxID=314037 RepID=A0AAE0XJQ3_9PEZI|nr:hypothetical protein B0T22DRAFT_496957 [Podospora appendiculata]
MDHASVIPACTQQASPPTSPLSPPPMWFNNDDIECPPYKPPALESPPTSPLSPPPMRFNNNDNECPPYEPPALESPPTKRARLGEQDTTQENYEILSQTGSSLFSAETNEAQTPLSDTSGYGDTEEARPIAHGKPEVWAKLRGGLCEALPYFRAYKGSLHSIDKVAAGFLINKEASVRDVFGSQVIISSVGGGRVRDAETNKMFRREDAIDDALNIKAIRKTHQNGSLVAVVADVWGEMQVVQAGYKAVRVWRVRLEKADLGKPSWWADQRSQTIMTTDGNETHSTAESTRAPSTECSHCNISSKEIFKTGWTCLNHTCDGFFNFAGKKDAIDISKLTYTKAFLSERTQFQGVVPSLMPPIPSSEGFHGTEKVLRRGFVCADCGCCNRRHFWNRWFCENCGFTLEATMQPYPDHVLEEETSKFDGLMSRRRRQNTVNQDDCEVDLLATRLSHKVIRLMQHLSFGRYKARQYFLPDIDGNIIGSFTLFISNPHINSMANGPNDLHRQLELLDIGLRRNPAAVVGHKLEGLTRHFQQNFGARYKFGVSVQSRGFDGAPEVILRALHRLRWAGQSAVKATTQMLAGRDCGPNAPPTESNDFNELLALGFMEDDRINELGPTVAALSLGSPSVMRFRPKLKSGLDESVSKSSNGKFFMGVLEVPMKHGDMMVMHGPAIQRLCEHAVEPMGGRRFSLTCRYIDPEKMASDEDRQEAAVKGAIPEYSHSFAYNGRSLRWA